MKEYVDIIGKPIQPGDFILYSAAAGRSAILKFGIVTDLSAFKANDWTDRGDDTKYVAAITLDYWSGGRLYQEADGYELQNNGKPVRLQFSERIYVLPLISIPSAAYKLLTNAMQSYHQKGGTK